MLSIVASEKWGHGYGHLYKTDHTPYKTEKGAFRNHPCTKWAMENIKIIPGAYDVVVSSKLLSQFTNEKYNLKYYIALEPDSTFG